MASAADEQCKKIERHLKSLLLSDPNNSSKSNDRKIKRETHPGTAASSSQQLDDREWPSLGIDAGHPTKHRKNQPVNKFQNVHKGATFKEKPRKSNNPNQNDHLTSSLENRHDSFASSKGRRRERSYSEGEPYSAGITRHFERSRKSNMNTRNNASMFMNGEIREEPAVFQNDLLERLMEAKLRSPTKTVIDLPEPPKSPEKPANQNDSAGHKKASASSGSIQKSSNVDSAVVHLGMVKELEMLENLGLGNNKPAVRSSLGPNKKNTTDIPSTEFSRENAVLLPKTKQPNNTNADSTTLTQKVKKEKKKKPKKEKGSAESEVHMTDMSADKQSAKSSQGLNRQQQRRKLSKQQRFGDKEPERTKNTFDPESSEKDNGNREKSRKFTEEDPNQNPKLLKKLFEENIQFATKETSDGIYTVYTCPMCEYVAFRTKKIRDHMSYKSHRQKKLLYQDGIPLHKIPSPTEAQIDALTELIEQIAAEQQISRDDIEAHQNVVDRLNTILKEEFPDCSLQLFGSLSYGMALKGSGIDLNLVVREGINPADVFIKLYEVLKDHVDFSQVVTDFFAKIPSLDCVDTATGYHCHISWNNTAACNTSKLISDYCAIDDRVKKLVIAFRYWAKLCGIDDQKRDMLPSYCYVLMLIYFLQQQIPPVLPVLHGLLKNASAAASSELAVAAANAEVYSSPQNAILNWKSKNKQKLGHLWLDLFRFYSVIFKYNDLVVSVRQLHTMKQADRRWHARGLAIEDPFSTKRNIARCVSTSTFTYIREMFKIAYKYFAIPQLTTGPLFTSLPSEFSAESCVKMLDTMSFESDVLEIHFDKKKNVETAGHLSKTDMSDLTLLEDDDKASDKSNGDEDDEDSSSSIADCTDLLEDHDIDIPVDSFVDVMKDMDLTEKKNENTDDVILCTDDDDDNCDVKGNEEDLETNKLPSLSQEENQLLRDNLDKMPGQRKSSIIEKIENCMNEVKKEDMQYKFDHDILTSGKVPPLYCRLCLKAGHLKQDCPEDKLPPLLPLPPIDPIFVQILDDLFQNIMRELIPSGEEITERHELLFELQTYIQDLYKDAKLELFGSSCNGFGFTQSDLDICLTFESEETGKDLNHVQIIEALAERLKRHKELHSVIPITTAKVPIVKFVHRHTKLDGDISLYNTLAKHNTRMLNTYCKVDQRVKILGYVMKYFAKVCDICDASRGSLSSYAYILMVIFFLQQRDPPVIPVLQELYDHTKPKPEVLVDDWNAWFFDDIEKLGEVWSSFEKNLESVGELWLGLLKFYTEEFDFEKYTISIRQKAPLSRLTKMWTSSNIAIEDPFNLNHNLGAGVSRKMSHYILSAFVHGRNLFGSPPPWLPPRYSEIKHFLFDPRLLTDGAPPNDRGCHLCGKIGHKLKECPRKTASRGQKRNQNQNRFKDSGDKRDSRTGKDQHESNPANRTSGRNVHGSNAKKNTSICEEPTSRGHHQQQSNQQQAFSRLLVPGFPVVSAHQSLLTSSTVGGGDTHNSGLPCHFRPASIAPASVPTPFPQQGQNIPKVAANLGSKQMTTTAGMNVSETQSALPHNWATVASNRDSYHRESATPKQKPVLANFPAPQQAQIHHYVSLLGSPIAPFPGVVPNVRPTEMGDCISAQKNASSHGQQPLAVSYTSPLFFQRVPFQQPSLVGTSASSVNQAKGSQSNCQPQQPASVQRMYDVPCNMPQSGPMMHHVGASGIIPGAATARAVRVPEQHCIPQVHSSHVNPHLLASQNSQSIFCNQANEMKSQESFMHPVGHQMKSKSSHFDK